MVDENTIKEEVKIEPEIEVIPEPESVSVETLEFPTLNPTMESGATDQIPVSEPLPTSIETSSEIIAEPVVETIQTETKTVETEIQPEPISESIPEPEVKPEPKIEESKPEPVSESKPEPKPIPEVIPAVIIIPKSKNLARELLVKARNMIQFRKRKKLEKVMTLFLKKQKITNDEVEKFMHVSDATATRYLSQLEKENKIKQTGKTGKSVFYSKI